jgi:hypothetical protein
MKYTVDQLELIAIMFKTQFGEKTLDEVFKIQSSIYKGKIKDLKIKRCDTFKGDINFSYPNNNVQMFFGPEKLFIYGEGMNEYGHPDQIVKLLDFTDKI